MRISTFGHTQCVFEEGLFFTRIEILLLIGCLVFSHWRGATVVSRPRFGCYSPSRKVHYAEVAEYSAVQAPGGEVAKVQDPRCLTVHIFLERCTMTAVSMAGH
jgi:hypothetical protein